MQQLDVRVSSSVQFEKGNRTILQFFINKEDKKSNIKVIKTKLHILKEENGENNQLINQK